MGKECFKKMDWYLSQFRGEGTIYNSEVGNLKDVLDHWTGERQVEKKWRWSPHTQSGSSGEKWRANKRCEQKGQRQAHATKRALWHVGSKYFQEPHCFHSQMEAEMLHWFSSNFSPKVLPGITECRTWHSSLSICIFNRNQSLG